MLLLLVWSWGWLHHFLWNPDFTGACLTLLLCYNVSVVLMMMMITTVTVWFYREGIACVGIMCWRLFIEIVFQIFLFTQQRINQYDIVYIDNGWLHDADLQISHVAKKLQIRLESYKHAHIIVAV